MKELWDKFVSELPKIWFHIFIIFAWGVSLAAGGWYYSYAYGLAIVFLTMVILAIFLYYRLR